MLEGTCDSARTFGPFDRGERPMARNNKHKHARYDINIIMIVMTKINMNIFLQAFIAGTLSALAFAPFDLFLPMVISVSWFYILLEESAKLPRKKVFLLGLAYGAGYFLAGNYWISISLLIDAARFGWLLPFSVTLFSVGLGLFFGFFAVAVNYLFNRYKFETSRKVLLFAMIWLGFELVRGYIFTGFPWNLAGYAMMFSDISMQSASIFGVYGLSFFTVIFCLIPVLYFYGKRQDRIFSYFLLLLFAGNLVFGFLRLENASLELMGKKIRLVQGNIKQSMKWDRDEKYSNFTKHLKISKSTDHEKVDGFIWSETSIPYPFGFNETVDLAVKKLVTDNDQFLISGALRIELDKFSGRVSKAFNSVYLFDKENIKHYDKHHLVPFGEYIPLQKYLPFVEKITGGGEGFASGSGPKTIEIDGIKVSPLICYEVIFPYNVVENGKRPDLFVNTTNDAWFLTSSGPYQHLNISKMRAVEYGISMARVANTGVSAYIDPFGRIVDQIALNKAGSIDVEIIRPIKSTILSHYKYSMLLYILLALIVLEKMFTTLIKPKKNEKLTKY